MIIISYCICKLGQHFISDDRYTQHHVLGYHLLAWDTVKLHTGILEYCSHTGNILHILEVQFACLEYHLHACSAFQILLVVKRLSAQQVLI